MPPIVGFFLDEQFATNKLKEKVDEHLTRWEEYRSRENVDIKLLSLSNDLKEYEKVQSHTR